jgi:ArsR family transcriptional regulator
MDENATKSKADLMKALAHPTRIKILEFLRHGEKCVCEIMPHLGLEQSNVSQHLALMRERGILSHERDGMKVMYSVKDPAVFDILGAFDSMLVRQLDEKRKMLIELEGR